MTLNKVQVTAEKAYARYVDQRCHYGEVSLALINQIVDTAYATGHWETWFDVFRDTCEVLLALKERCKWAHIQNSR